MNPCPKPGRIDNPELRSEVAQQQCAAGSGCMGDVVAHHVTSKGARGDDVHENLMPLCVNHHNLIHAHGNRWMCDQFPLVRRWLQQSDRWDILDQIDQLNFGDSEKLQIR